ncbi:uncharacterized protein MYCGRDRAFT_106029 [Zymoseptoria tritici IPO323]|uniref:Uncharacterized protein n=1 Tax=Zymoseptoria tritici (strain CBS 115943 / IPO323) TaxID=336722 RepID=F9XME1_ZYMTI|nr:uncharacterized protein MYCGRDRAFT_106029 [Zymoseptoria tritici IPO323]EGP83716.1 hypothetical protein MYCGRDRAFT_106029 [Zymoseptoria tritici IPO323]
MRYASGLNLWCLPSTVIVHRTWQHDQRLRTWTLILAKKCPIRNVRYSGAVARDNANLTALAEHCRRLLHFGRALRKARTAM